MSASAPKQIESHAEMREALRALCREYDSAYWQGVDEARGYPEAFVDALTKAGWLAALIP
jgi:acyl-CoA dehydrogenase